MINRLELAKSTGAQILQASTSEIYGDSLVHPLMEMLIVPVFEHVMMKEKEWQKLYCLTI